MADKYQEALERARKIKEKLMYSHLSTESCKAVAEYIDEIIPELIDNGDEKIKKCIGDCLSLFGEDSNLFDKYNLTKDDILAWLEKQKAPVNTSASTMAPSCWEEQKSSSTEDMPYITDEHFWEREHADSFKYKLAEYMTKNCRKEEGPYGYTYGISAESILKMAEEELLKRGVVQKPAEWGEECQLIGFIFDLLNSLTWRKDWAMSKEECLERLKSLRPVKQEWNEEDDWNEEDQTLLSDALGCVTMVQELKKLGRLSEFHISCSYDELRSWIRSLKSRPRKQPHWKPSEEQMEALNDILGNTPDWYKPKCTVESLLNDLKKLM